LIPINEYKARHNHMLNEILSTAGRSKLFDSRLGPISGIEQLSDLPITPYEAIAKSIETHGLDKVLLAPSAKYYETSGSTGSPKKIYVGDKDIERITNAYLMVAHIVGLRPGDVVWNLGSTEPQVGGHIIDVVSSKIPAGRCISTFLSNDTDLLKALKLISKEEKVDGIATAALVYYIIGRMVIEPDYMDNLVKDKLIRAYHVPRFLAGTVASIYLSGLDKEGLLRIAKSARFGLSYAEPLTAYTNEISNGFPNMQTVDIYGSTENPLTAAELTPDATGLSLFLSVLIPEIADPKVVVEAKANPSIRVPGVPWYAWEKGMKGEMIVTRLGQCLPLIRYPTGDIIEVVDPAHENVIELGGRTETIVLPLIRVLGRSADVMDFEVTDEIGNFLGNKIYSRNITDALNHSSNVKWWELYNIKGNPGRLVFLIIPERDMEDVEAYHKEILRCLLKECDDYHKTLETSCDLGRLEVMITKAKNHSIIQAEIDRRVKEGRSIGQLKPKHIFVMESEAAFQKAIAEKFRD
jgi:phenylacetate-coenzyme A ligase PaaK-like adenylate-forming protein